MKGASGSVMVAARIASSLAVPPELMRVAAGAATRNGTEIIAEMIAAGIPEVSIYRAFAQLIGVPFIEHLAPERLVITNFEAIPSDARLPLIHYVDDQGGTVVISAPTSSTMEALLSGGSNIARPGLCIVAPGRLRAALIERDAVKRARIAAGTLFDQAPMMSARTVATSTQGTVLGFLLGALPALLVAEPEVTLLALHLAASLFFFSCVALRLYAALSMQARGTKIVVDAVKPSRLPRYAVLVALYDEADVVPQLVASLKRLNWPRSKLEIWFACEADDTATRAALADAPLQPHMNVLAVPDIGP